MLTSLHIENYALISQSDTTFNSGFVAITGETGAGKSILLGALGLLLGNRADMSVLANKERKCVVEAQFDIQGLGLEPLLHDADIDCDPILILRREILPSAKSRAFVNDTPVGLPMLKQLGARLLDIHSQHQTLTLADSGFRLSLLDTLSSSVYPSPTSATADQTPFEAYSAAYAAYSLLKHQLEELTATEAQNRRDADYLQFQFNELFEANLVPDEQEQLEQEQQLLAHSGAVCEGLAQASAALADDGPTAALPALRAAKTALAHIASYHPEASTLLDRLESALIEVDDINSEVQSLADRITFSPERQELVEQRLSLLYRLQHKHGVQTVEELIALRDSLDCQLQNMSTLDTRIHALMEQVDAAYHTLQQAATVLTQSRQQAATLLGQQILPTLHRLGMPQARFEVQLQPTATFTPTGHDKALFLFNANRGSDLRDLSLVASGGELSRLMLAIKSMLTSHTLLPTILFDEIDTGVSGDIAGAVGQTMATMAQRMQVIVITHLPQVAARASQHLKVYKQLDTASDRTVSLIKNLTPADREHEVAVMLSADPPTPAALQTARELILNSTF